LIDSFAERLMLFAAVEGIFLQVHILFYLLVEKRGLMPGLTFQIVDFSWWRGVHCDFTARAPL
jgi:ribonucleoside-diphosphate reductase beta chain